MSESEYSWGYCVNCMKNVPHFRAINFYPFRVIDRLSFGFLKQLRIGPWYCAHCERKSYILNRELANAPHHDPSDSFRSLDSVDETNQYEHQSTGQPVGNFIKNEHSLVRRASRLKRFSEKYRDAIVRRILAGKLTLTQAKQEQDATETELIDWIWDLVDRLETKLAASPSIGPTDGQQGRATPELMHLQSDAQSRSEDADLSSGPIIEGHVRPK